MPDVNQVPFTLKNISRCLCQTCPVQVASYQVAALKDELRSALRRSPLNTELIPALYCSSGKAVSTDLKPNRQCQCVNCDIHAEYKLNDVKYVGKFCQSGSAL